MHIINEIDNYIKYLKENQNLKITLHPRERECVISGSKLIKYNIHTSPYCTYIKSNPELRGICIKNQNKIKSKAIKNSPFTGVCHCGVKERVYGLFNGSDYLGFISVSGYKDKDSNKYTEDIAKRYGFKKEYLNNSYNNLSEKFPDENRLDTLITPLCRMIEYGNVLYREKHGNTGELYINILNYINNHFHENISVEILAKKFNVSKSQISHNFKKNRGESIREYISKLRVDFSKTLLRDTNESITDIAYIVGFADASYYTNTFKRLCTVTPKEYRENT